MKHSEDMDDLRIEHKMALEQEWAFKYKKLKKMIPMDDYDLAKVWAAMQIK